MKKENSYIISLCIPTDGSVQWVIPVLRHIFSLKTDRSLFEVVVADNGKSDELSRAMSEFDEPNLVYFKSEEKGFVNQMTCFKAAKGHFIKMLNHRSIIENGILEIWIDLVKDRIEKKPVIYCTNGSLNGKLINRFNSFDDFVRELSIYTTWSGGFGIWKSDLPYIDKLVIDSMFPTCSLVLGVRRDSPHEIWNHHFENQLPEKGKGGYNLFYYFGVGYPNLLKELLDKKQITSNTFNCLLKDLKKFLCDQYFEKKFLRPDYFTFDLSEMKKNVSAYLGVKAYYEIIAVARKRQLSLFMRHCYRKIFVKEVVK